MRFTSVVGLLVPLASAENLVIPAVERAVSLQLAKFSDYYVDAANQTLDLRSASSSPDTHDARGIEERQTSTYWYETIGHQGISAFNADKTYKVYRNVKSYGAKGYEEL